MQGVGWCREDGEGGEAVTRVVMLSLSLWNALLTPGSECLAKQAGLCLVPKGVSGSTGKYSAALASALSRASAAAFVSLKSAKLFCRSLQLGIKPNSSTAWLHYVPPPSHRQPK